MPDADGVKKKIGHVQSVTVSPSSVNIAKHWESSLFIMIVCIGVMVRFGALANFPMGMNQDEISAGYDSFALLTEGTDRHGLPYPVVLPAWGPGMNSLASYVEMPFIMVFGLTSFAVRLPFAIIGCLTLLFFYLFLEILTDKRTALIGLFLLTVSPWHIAHSRWGLEANLLPPLFLLGAWGVSKSLHKEDPRWFYVAALGFGLSLYTYATAYVALPVFLCLIMVFLLRRHKKMLLHRHALGAGLLLVLLATPLILFVAINMLQWQTISIGHIFSIPRLPTNAQFIRASLLASPHPFTSALTNIGILGKQLIKQNDGTLYNVLPGFGILYPMAVPLGLIGIGIAVKKLLGGDNQIIVLMAWFLAGLVPCMLVTININRANVILLPLIAFAAVGLRSIDRWQIVFVTVTTSFVTFFLLFLQAYFILMAPAIGNRFQYGLLEAIRTAESASGSVCITNRATMPYIYVLFASRLSPKKYSSTVQFVNPHADFQNVRSFDRYTFGLSACETAQTKGFVLHSAETEGNAALFRNAHVERFGSFIAIVRQ